MCFRAEGRQRCSILAKGPAHPRLSYLSEKSPCGADKQSVDIDLGPLHLGVEDIDRDHRHILELSAELQSAVLGGRPAAAKECLRILRAFVAAHFEREEARMHNDDYPGLPLHHKQHEGVLEALSDLECRIGNDRAADFDPVVFLRDWIERHIVDFDAPAARHAAARLFRETFSPRAVLKS